MRLVGAAMLGLVATVVCGESLLSVGNHARAAGPEPPEVVATQAIVIDATTGDILYAKAEREQVAPASLTKLFTAFVAIESAPLTQMMTVDESALVGEASMGLNAGEELPFETLLNGMLLASGNDAAMTVAENIGYLAGDTPRQAADRFLNRANARLAELGMTDTHLVNPHGLDQDGQMSSARDIAAITLIALQSQSAIAEILGTATYRGFGHTLQQTNELLGRYQGLIGGKTGFTGNAGYCLVEIAERDGNRVIAVLLGSSADAWYMDAAALLDYGFVALTNPGMQRFGSVIWQSAVAAIAPSADDVSEIVSTSAPVAGDRVVAPTSAVFATSRSSWRWFGATLVGVMVLTFAVGQLQRAWRRFGMLHAPRAALPETAHAQLDLPTHWNGHTQPLPSVPRWSSVAQPATGVSARSLAHRAVTLAERSDFAEAARAFYAAARLDARLDLTSTPGFWSLCPRGHSAAAQALVKAGRLADARSLAVVLGLGR